MKWKNFKNCYCCYIVRVCVCALYVYGCNGLLCLMCVLWYICYISVNCML